MRFDLYGGAFRMAYQDAIPQRRRRDIFVATHARPIQAP